jgi:hypothetical protein
MNPSHSTPDDFQVVDLFSPSETTFAPPAPAGAGQTNPPSAPRMSGEMPESFVFTHPFFAPVRTAKSPRQVG